MIEDLRCSFTWEKRTEPNKMWVHTRGHAGACLFECTENAYLVHKIDIRCEELGASLQQIVWNLLRMLMATLEFSVPPVIWWDVLWPLCCFQTTCTSPVCRVVSGIRKHGRPQDICWIWQIFEGVAVGDCPLFFVREHKETFKREMYLVDIQKICLTNYVTDSLYVCRILGI